MRITMQQFEEFEKEFLMDILKDPNYRLGQAFINKHPKISISMEGDGDLGYMQWQKLWEARNRDEVLKLIDWYLEK